MPPCMITQQYRDKGSFCKMNRENKNKNKQTNLDGYQVLISILFMKMQNSTKEQRVWESDVLTMKGSLWRWKQDWIH